MIVLMYFHQEYQMADDLGSFKKYIFYFVIEYSNIDIKLWYIFVYEIPNCIMYGINLETFYI